MNQDDTRLTRQFEQERLDIEQERQILDLYRNIDTTDTYVLADLVDEIGWVQ